MASELSSMFVVSIPLYLLVSEVRSLAQMTGDMNLGRWFFGATRAGWPKQILRSMYGLEGP